MLDRLMREMMRDQGRHRRGRRGHRRRGSRRQTNVRVGGCCLPIPLAMVLGSGVLARAGIRKARG